MSVPAFTAQAALQRPTGHYQTTALHGALSGGAVPAQGGSDLIPQGCGISCVIAIGGCVSCLTSPTCWISCLGSLYNECKDCIPM